MSTLLSAQESGPAGSFPLNHPIYFELRDLLRAAERPLFSWSPPFSVEEIRTYLDTIDPSILDASQLELYDRIEARLAPHSKRGSSSPLGQEERPVPGDLRLRPWLLEEGGFSLSLDPQASFELRIRSDPGLAWMQQSRDEKPLISLPIEIDFERRLQGVIDFDIMNSPLAYRSSSACLDTNVPWPITDVDLSVPYRAFLQTGGKWWSLRLGRDQLEYGAGLSGNLALSRNPDYLDFARFSLFNRLMRYTGLVVQLPLFLDRLDTSSSDLAALATESPARFDPNEKDVHRYLYYSRIDLNIMKRLGLSIGQGMMIGKSPLELRYLNPFIVFHSQWPWNNYTQTYIQPQDGSQPYVSVLAGSLFTIDVDLALPAGFGFYAQYAMNEFTTGSEREVYGNTNTPDSIAIMAGLEWVTVLDRGRLSLSLEGVWGSTYLYLLTSPFSSFIWMSRDSELYPGDRHYSWLGHPNARDSLYFHLDARFSEGLRSWKARASCHLKGEQARLVYDYAKTDENASFLAPSGLVEYRLALCLSMDWDILSRLSLGAACTLYQHINHNHVEAARASGVQASMYVSWKAFE